MGSAYVNHLDDDTGTITVGKLADLAVVDRDLFDPTPARFAAPASSRRSSAGPPCSRIRPSRLSAAALAGAHGRMTMPD